MAKAFTISLLCFAVLICFPVHASAALNETNVAEQSAQVNKSRKRLVIKVQHDIEAGKFDSAIILLEGAITDYKQDDVVSALYGEALYLSGRIDEAEVQFMNSLSINAHNFVAKKYIEDIRDVKSLSVSEEEQEWLSVARDKVGDFIVLVLSIWLGTTLNSFGASFKKYRFRSKGMKAFQNGDYVYFTDLIEQQAGEENYTAMRHSLEFMLTCKSEDEVRQILKDYVDNSEHHETLAHMLNRYEYWTKK